MPFCRSNRDKTTCIELRRAVALQVDMAEPRSLRTRHRSGKTVDRSRRSVWEQFRNDKRLHHAYNVKPEELESLSRLAMLGNVASKEDYLFILKMLRAKGHGY